MSSSTTSEFQTVDLDAVLDEFESSQSNLMVSEHNDDQKSQNESDDVLKTPTNKKDIVKESVFETTSHHASAEVMKPNILEDLKAKDGTLGHRDTNDSDCEDYEQALDEQNHVEDEQGNKQDTASVTSNPQPDVLSGLENVTISQHLQGKKKVQFDI